ncbi:hypothetical protein RJT34_30511 [Clitoria ternatea]|uniref:DUF4218 domain-containing protein n=1 Tax=Clitoria ternatea TaxID=43366 RepID=A0AAN9I446_CLITE
MVHLVVHLVEEAKLGGPVHYRWMYPIERYLGLLKSYVTNKARPEGSIAEGYLMQEILTFCSRHVLTNCPAVDCYLQEFRDVVRGQLRRRARNATDVDKKVHREFVSWFTRRIFQDVNNISESDKNVLLCLAQVIKKGTSDAPETYHVEVDVWTTNKKWNPEKKKKKKMMMMMKTSNSPPSRTLN